MGRFTVSVTVFLVAVMDADDCITDMHAVKAPSPSCPCVNGVMCQLTDLGTTVYQWEIPF